MGEDSKPLHVDGVRYDRKIATASADEFGELMAILRSEPEPVRPLTPDDHWRRAYQHDQQNKRVVGSQGDLFSTRTITHYRRHRPAPEVEAQATESIEAKLERIKDDPFATFGPERADRPAYLSKDEKAAIVRGAQNWLRVRQRVRIVDAPGAVDPEYGPHLFLGREGVIWKLCDGTFDDHCYVFLDPVGAERTAKIRMVELRDIEPIS
ncbi:MAG TPA: hypothetical protein VF463_09760 [Sphingobium sp.]